MVFVKYITFHQMNLLDNVHKVWAILTDRKLRLGLSPGTPLIHWNKADLLVLYWHWKYLPEKAQCNYWIRTYSLQVIVRIWYVAAGKLFVVVESPDLVEIWSGMLSSNSCHLTLVRILHHFCTHLTIFAKFWYYFDFDKSPITLHFSRDV